jgi:TolA-binding protein
MKKLLVVTFLAFALAAAAVPEAAAQAAAQPAAQQPAAQPAKPQIKDPAEYNAYVSAVQQSDPAAKAQAIEAFLQTYPNSVMKEDALVTLMGAYQQAGNASKTIDTASRVLQANPNNVR